MRMLQPLNTSTYYYFNNTSSHGSDNFFKAVTYSLYYIGTVLKNNSSGGSSSSAWTSSQASTVTTNSSNIRTDVDSIKNNVSSMSTYLSSISSNTYNTSSYLSTISTKIGTYSSSYSLKDAIDDILVELTQTNLYLHDLHEIFASPEDLALKHAQENNVSNATTDFLNGTDSNTSIGSGKTGIIKTIGNDAGNFLNTDVNPSTIFTLLSASGPWRWFTAAVADDLNPVANNRRGIDEVDYLHQKNQELDDILRGLSD